MFEGKVIIVTGGASGIGNAICRKFAEYGGAIALMGILEEKGTAALRTRPCHRFIPGGEFARGIITTAVEELLGACFATDQGAGALGAFDAGVQFLAFDVAALRIIGTGGKGAVASLAPHQG